MIPGTSFRLSESMLGAFVLAIGLFISLETYETASTTGVSALIGPQLFPYIVGFGLIVIGLPLLREAETPRSRQGRAGLRLAKDAEAHSKVIKEGGKQRGSGRSNSE